MQEVLLRVIEKVCRRCSCRGKNERWELLTAATTFSTVFLAGEAEPAALVLNPFQESIVDDKDLGEDNETVLEDRKQDEAAAATKKKREEEALQSSYRTQKKAKRMKIKKRKKRKQ